MRTIQGPEAGSHAGPRIAALGVFDGVHAGHQAIIEKALGWAAANGSVAEVITFDPHPRAVVGSGSPLCLTSLAHRLLLFERYGVDQCRVLTFDADMAAMGADEFAERFLRGAVGVVTGYDQRFGCGREGGPDALRAVGARLGFEVEVVQPVAVDGEPVSSTAIRTALTANDMGRVAAMLGRPYSVYGRVVQGAGIGRGLGYPTANLDLGAELAPPEGVYCAEVWLAGDERFDALTNVGRRPTFAGEGGFAGDVRVEAYLLDFDGSLYGRDIEIVFLEKLRDEIACASHADLTRLIDADLAALRRRGAGDD